VAVLVLVGLHDFWFFAWHLTPPKVFRVPEVRVAASGWSSDSIERDNVAKVLEFDDANKTGSARHLSGRMAGRTIGQAVASQIRFPLRRGYREQ
jgi:hypothetical protein